MPNCQYQLHSVLLCSIYERGYRFHIGSAKSSPRKKGHCIHWKQESIFGLSKLICTEERSYRWRNSTINSTKSGDYAREIMLEHWNIVPRSGTRCIYYSAFNTGRHAMRCDIRCLRSGK